MCDVGEDPYEAYCISLHNKIYIDEDKLEIEQYWAGFLFTAICHSPLLDLKGIRSSRGFKSHIFYYEIF